MDRSRTYQEGGTGGQTPWSYRVSWCNVNYEIKLKLLWRILLCLQKVSLRAIAPLNLPRVNINTYGKTRSQCLFTNKHTSHTHPNHFRTSIMWWSKWEDIINSNSQLNDIHFNTHPQLVSSMWSLTCSEAIPKSATLIFLCSSSNRFSGFKSRWLN